MYDLIVIAIDVHFAIAHSFAAYCSANGLTWHDSHNVGLAEHFS